MKRKYIIIISFVLFLLLLVLYLSNNLNIIDTVIYNNIIKFKTTTLTNFMKIITFFASTKFIFCLVIIFFIISLFKKKIPFIINGLIIGETLLNNIIKIIVKRDRPTLINLVTETSYSFPSGHTMAAVVFYGFLIYLILKSNINKPIKILSISVLSIIIILIMVSRIYLGVHYFSDVLAGMFLSISYLLTMITILEKKEIL